MTAAIDARKIEREMGWKPAETFDTASARPQWHLTTLKWVAQVQSGAYREWAKSNTRPTTPAGAVAFSNILPFGKGGQVGVEP